MKKNYWKTISAEKFREFCRKQDEMYDRMLESVNWICNKRNEYDRWEDQNKRIEEGLN